MQLVTCAAFVLAVTLSTTIAFDQVATKGTMFLGASRSLAGSSICLDGSATCHELQVLSDGTRLLQQTSVNASADALVPVNETTGTPEIVCFGPCCARCYQYRRRLQNDVDAEQRRLEVTGEGGAQEIACVNQEWGLECL